MCGKLDMHRMMYDVLLWRQAVSFEASRFGSRYFGPWIARSAEGVEYVCLDLGSVRGENCDLCDCHTVPCPINTGGPISMEIGAL
mgnify:CR=1 FL=1|jgi:hypothetical protein